MEVTRKNFKESLPLVSASIKKADFLVIDTEFTGLINGRDVSIFDTPEEYYTTLLNGSSEFLLIQYGLCAFYWNEEKNHYMNDAYNFYLFPRGRPGPERVFLCQSSSLDFLAAQGFDFNKLIKEGISYMTEPTETRLRENLTERQKQYSNDHQSISIPDENKQHIEEICKKVRDFLDDNKEEALEIDRCNAFIRRLLFQELGARFKDEAFVETKVLENKSRVLKVTRINSAGESKMRDSQKKEKEWEEFEDAVGFSKVARMISQSEKLVIGHNMILDLLHTLNHFFQPLPLDYSSFKEFAHCMFPKLLDTKYMSSLPPFKDKVNSSVLQHLYATLSQPPFSLPTVESINGRGYSHADDKHHEAGYDAFVTGLCFLGMQTALARMRGDHSPRVGADSPALKPFINKLFLARTAHQHSPYMNLAGPDPTPPRDHVFHLTFPKEWQRNDINQLFSPFGPIIVQFLDDTSALIALARRDQSRDVVRALTNKKAVSLVPFSRYKTQLTKASKIQDKLSRKSEGEINTMSSPESRSQQVSNDAVVKPRMRSSSMTSSTPTMLTRKRTSSGVFQIDETEPPPKKSELVRSESEIIRKRTEVNGLQVTEDKSKLKEKDRLNKNIEKKEKEKINNKDIGVKIDRFDKDSKSKCVSAFKESDNWE